MDPCHCPKSGAGEAFRIPVATRAEDGAPADFASRGAVGTIAEDAHRTGVATPGEMPSGKSGEPPCLCVCICHSKQTPTISGTAENLVVQAYDQARALAPGAPPAPAMGPVVPAFPVGGQVPLPLSMDGPTALPGDPLPQVYFRPWTSVMPGAVMAGPAMAFGGGDDTPMAGLGLEVQGMGLLPVKVRHGPLASPVEERGALNAGISDRREDAVARSPAIGPRDPFFPTSTTPAMRARMRRRVVAPPLSEEGAEAGPRALRAAWFPSASQTRDARLYGFLAPADGRAAPWEVGTAGVPREVVFAPEGGEVEDWERALDPPEVEDLVPEWPEAATMALGPAALRPEVAGPVAAPPQGALDRALAPRGTLAAALGGSGAIMAPPFPGMPVLPGPPSRAPVPSLPGLPMAAGLAKGPGLRVLPSARPSARTFQHQVGGGRSSAVFAVADAWSQARAAADAAEGASLERGQWEWALGRATAREREIRDLRAAEANAGFTAQQASRLQVLEGESHLGFSSSEIVRAGAKAEVREKAAREYAEVLRSKAKDMESKAVRNAGSFEAWLKAQDLAFEAKAREAERDRAGMVRDGAGVGSTGDRKKDEENKVAHVTHVRNAIAMAKQGRQASRDAKKRIHDLAGKASPKTLAKAGRHAANLKKAAAAVRRAAREAKNANRYGPPSRADRAKKALAAAEEKQAGFRKDLNATLRMAEKEAADGGRKPMGMGPAPGGGTGGGDGEGMDAQGEDGARTPVATPKDEVIPEGPPPEECNGVPCQCPGDCPKDRKCAFCFVGHLEGGQKGKGLPAPELAYGIVTAMTGVLRPFGPQGTVYLDADLLPMHSGASVAALAPEGTAEAASGTPAKSARRRSPRPRPKPPGARSSSVRTPGDQLGHGTETASVAAVAPPHSVYAGVPFARSPNISPASGGVLSILAPHLYPAGSPWGVIAPDGVFAASDVGPLAPGVLPTPVVQEMLRLKEEISRKAAGEMEAERTVALLEWRDSYLQEGAREGLLSLREEKYALQRELQDLERQYGVAEKDPWFDKWIDQALLLFSVIEIQKEASGRLWSGLEGLVSGTIAAITGGIAAIFRDDITFAGVLDSVKDDFQHAWDSVTWKETDRVGVVERLAGAMIKALSADFNYLAAQVAGAMGPEFGITDEDLKVAFEQMSKEDVEAALNAFLSEQDPLATGDARDQGHMLARDFLLFLMALLAARSIECKCPTGKAPYKPGSRVGKSSGKGSPLPEGVKPKYPPNDGFHGPPEWKTLKPGDKFIRWGGDGKFGAPEGTLPKGVSIPPDKVGAPVHTYEVVKPMLVEAGPAEPWFGQPGMGTQYKFPTRVQTLIDRGYLREVK